MAPTAELDLLWITAGLGCDGDTIVKNPAGANRQTARSETEHTQMSPNLTNRAIWF
jgi:hypothetical protein